MLVPFNKPFNVLSQFTGGAHARTLAEFIDIPNVYATGRLDADSEGLLLLTDNGALQAEIAGSRSNVTKTYWAQVEGVSSPRRLERLRFRLVLRRRLFNHLVWAATAFGGTASVPPYPCAILLT